MFTLFFNFRSFHFTFITLLVTSNIINGQVRIDPNYVAALPRPGFKLIFSDEFNAFDSNTWNRSHPGNDLLPYGHPDLCSGENRNTVHNVENVLEPTNGSLPLQVKEGEKMNACDFSGAEIKTFSVSTGDQFRHWTIPINSYLEGRFLVPECPGVGAAFWLYGGVGGDNTRFFEIDMFELYGHHNDRFQSNIHYGKKYKDVTHLNHPKVIKVEDLDHNTVDLDEQYLTFGVFHDSKKIELTLNGELYAEYYFAGNGDAKNNPYLNPLPLNIRIGVGNTAVGRGNPALCEELPKLLEVDYVRLFIKDGEKSIKTRKSTKYYFCSDFSWGDGNKIQVTYIPGATYQWENISNFNITPFIQDRQGGVEEFWVSLEPGTPVGKYTNNLTVSFPSGYSEVIPFEFEVVSNAPQPPTGIQIFTQDNWIHYLATPIAATTLGYEWSIDGGITWIDQPNSPNEQFNILNSPLIPNPEIGGTYMVCVRSYNKCRRSLPFCTEIHISPICPNCYYRPVTPKDVIIEKVPNFDYYSLKVLKHEGTDSYDWSFDKENWYKVDNKTGEAYNYFGEFDPGTPPFNIYVRGRFNDTLTHICSQLIVIPDTLNNMHPSVYFNQPIKDLLPSNQYDTTNYGDSIEEPYSVFIFNTLGQFLMQLNETDINHGISRKLAPGIYIVIRRGNQSGKTMAKKIFVHE